MVLSSETRNADRPCGEKMMPAIPSKTVRVSSRLTWAALSTPIVTGVGVGVTVGVGRGVFVTVGEGIRVGVDEAVGLGMDVADGMRA